MCNDHVYTATQSYKCQVTTFELGPPNFPVEPVIGATYGTTSETDPLTRPLA